MQIKIRVRHGNIRRNDAVHCIRYMTGEGLRESSRLFDMMMHDFDEHNTSLYTVTLVSEIQLFSDLCIIHGEYNAFNIFHIETIDGRNPRDIIIGERALTIDSMNDIVKRMIITLMELDAPVVLQTAVPFFNAIKKHLKQHPSE